MKDSSIVTHDTLGILIKCLCDKIKEDRCYVLQERRIKVFLFEKEKEDHPRSVFNLMTLYICAILTRLVAADLPHSKSFSETRMVKILSLHE